MGCYYGDYDPSDFDRSDYTEDKSKEHQELEDRMDQAADFLVGIVDHFSGRRVVNEDELERFVEEMCNLMKVEFFPFYSHIKEPKEFKRAI